MSTLSPATPHSSTGFTPASLEKPRVRLGFVPLSDCAPLVMAKALDLGRQYGLEIELVRVPSWAALRDKLLSGEIDAAHALYGMVYGVQLGIGGPQADMAVLMTLNQNGQAITLSNRLTETLRGGQTLKQIVDASERQLVFGQTFPTGTHAMWLYYWLAAQGVHPLKDVRSVVIAPPEMTAALAHGDLDGFCAGEPWNAVAEAEKVGHTQLASSQIWPDHPEKVLACRRDFVALHPHTAQALIMTILESCRWLEVPANRREAAVKLAAPEYIGCASTLIAPRLLGDYGNALAQPPGIHFFAAGEVNYPWISDGMWFLTQFRRWGFSQISGADMTTIAASVNQTALYRAAADALVIPTPVNDRRASVLFDGITWDGSAPQSYADAFAIHARR